MNLEPLNSKIKKTYPGYVEIGPDYFGVEDRTMELNKFPKDVIMEMTSGPTCVGLLNEIKSEPEIQSISEVIYEEKGLQVQIVVTKLKEEFIPTPKNRK
jgi:hypothetical protein